MAELLSDALSRIAWPRDPIQIWALRVRFKWLDQGDRGDGPRGTGSRGCVKPPRPWKLGGSASGESLTARLERTLGNPLERH